ncbi:T9SS type A sorting domain-containing protein [candidate division KSB1 bacterium]
MKIRNYLLSFSALVVVLVAVIFIVQSLDKQSKYIPRSMNIDNSKEIGGATKWLAKLRNDPQTGELNLNAFLKARKEVEYFTNQQTKALGLTWENMGPDNVGGRTRAILIDKNNPNTLYAGGVSGGLWKSTTAGSSWVQVSSVAENLAISSIAQATNGTIYVGTGEGLTGFGGTNATTVGVIGAGMYKSVNGIDFSIIPSTEPNSSQDWLMINRIACDPVNSNRIYAATNNSFYISNDGGITWKTPKYQLNTLYFNLSGESHDVKVGPDGSVVVAVNSRCFTSDNGNDSTYISRSTGGPNNLPSGGLSRIELAIAPSNTNILYCVAAADGSTGSYSYGDLYNIYRSNDKGLTWYIIAPGLSQNFNLFGDNAQGHYDNVIAVYPNNPDAVLVGGIDMWKGTRVSPTGYFNWTQTTAFYNVHVDHHGYYFHPTNPNIIYIGTDGGIFRSNDGAYSWQELNKNYTTLQLFAVALSGQGQVMGGTQDNSTPYISLYGNTPQAAEVLWNGDGGWAAFSLINNKVVFATSQNAYLGRSPDRGDNWQNWEDFYADKMLMDNPNYPASSSIEFIPNFGASFVTPLLLWESFGDNLSKDSVEYIVKDNNIPAGTTIQIKSYNNKYPFNYTTTQNYVPGDTILVKDIIQTKFFLGYYGGVWMTKQALDFSKTPEWYNIASFNGTVQSMAYSTDGNHLFVGTQNGGLYRISGIQDGYDSLTLDEASSQTMIQTDNINNFGRFITSVSVDPKDANRVIVTLGAYGTHASWIYFSSNALSSSPNFSIKKGDLPNMPVYASLIEMNNSNTVIVGTDFGIYATDNILAAAPTWTFENSGIDVVPVFMIRQQTSNNPGATAVTIDGNDTIITVYPGVTNYGAIYIGTYGRGFYKCENYVGIDEFPENSVFSKPQLNVYPNPAIDQTNISFKLKNASNINLNVFDMKGTLIKGIDLSRMPAGTHKYALDISTLSRGTYIIQLLSGNNRSTSKLVVY